MNNRKFICLLITPVLLMCGCNSSEKSSTIATPASTSTPTSTPTASPTPTPLPDISYIELAQQAGFIQFKDAEAVQGITFSVWLPETYMELYRNEMYRNWESGNFLDAAAKRIGDYAYDIYAEHTLFTGSDTTFYAMSPHANECSSLTNTVDVNNVDFAIRSGQDLQLADMTLANYAGLLAIALQQIRGEHQNYPQVSEPFFVPGYEAWRIVTDFDLSDYAPYTYRITFIDYILKTSDRIWVLTFSVDTELFWEASPCSYLADEFDLIVRTFEAVPNGN